MGVAAIKNEEEFLFKNIDDKETLQSIASLPTEDDLPCDDGEPMETSQHRDQMILLIQSLQAFWSDSRRYYIGGNMFLHFDPENKRKFKGPDFFLVMDVDHRQRKSWVVWQEDMRFPDVIIELLSDSTRKIDKGLKKELYARVFKTPEYYFYDPHSQEFQGHRLSEDRYETIIPDDQNRIFSHATGLFLVIHDNWLRWMTKDGQIVPTPFELSYQEKQRADQEKIRADQEKIRADQEKIRADQEKQKAAQSEKRLIETARKMAANGYSLAEVTALTGVSEDQITTF